MGELKLPMASPGASRDGEPAGLTAASRRVQKAESNPIKPMARKGGRDLQHGMELKTPQPLTPEFQSSLRAGDFGVFFWFFFFFPFPRWEEGTGYPRLAKNFPWGLRRGNKGWDG